MKLSKQGADFIKSLGCDLLGVLWLGARKVKR